MRAIEGVLSGVRDTSCAVAVLSAVDAPSTTVAVSCGVPRGEDEQATVARAMTATIMKQTGTVLNLVAAMNTSLHPLDNILLTDYSVYGG